jgi:enolase
MSDDAEAANERKKIEDYLKLYCMEECLDEIVNGIIVDMPSNPYMAIAAAMEAKTMCEIIDISLSPIVVGQNIFGVQATVVTNIGPFTGVACYSTFAEENQPDEIRNYDALKSSIQDIILELDPTNISKIDQLMAAVPMIEMAESMAISIACCRAAARHKAIKPYQFISGLMEIDWKKRLQIPLPIVSILSRVSEDQSFTQNITLVATDRVQSFATALRMTMTASRAIAAHENMKKPSMVSSCGSASIAEIGLTDAIKMVKQALSDTGVSNIFKLGVNLSANQMIIPIEGEQEISSFQYKLDKGTAPLLEAPAADTPTPAKGKKTPSPVTVTAPSEVSGVEFVDHIDALWQDTEMVTIENVLHEKDIEGLKAMKKKIQETVTATRQAKSGRLEYCLTGVGNDLNCNLQVTINGPAFLAIADADVPQFLSEMPYNTIKLQLCNLPSMSSAIEICKKAKKYKLAVMVAASDMSIYPESPDTILADLAVGVGARQFSAGGLAVAENYSKYNRILEIVGENADTATFVGASFRVDKI